MADEVVDVVRHLLRAEVHGTQSGAYEHDAPLHGGEGRVEVEMTRGVPGERFVGGGHVLGLQKMRHAAELEHRCEGFEHPVRVGEPRQVELARSERRHLPVEDRARPEAAVHDVADTRVAPADNGRARVCGQMVVEPGEEAVDDARPMAFPGVVVPSSGVVDQPLEVRRAGVIVGKEGETVHGILDTVQVGEHLDRGVLERALLFGCGVEEPVVAEGVGHDVGRDDAVDPLHDEERHAGRLAGRVGPPHPWDRHRRELANEADDLELALEVVAREHGHVGGIGGDARYQPLGLGRAPLGPLGGEQDGLARHPVGRRGLQLRDLRLGARGKQAAQPGLQTGPQLLGVAARPVHVDLRRTPGVPHQRVRIGGP